MKKHQKIAYLIIAVGILSSIFLRQDIFNLEVQGRHSWRQSHTGLNISNFADGDLNLFNPRVGHFNVNDSNISRLEFPLMQWLIAMIQKITIKEIFVVRLCLFLISLLSLLAVYKLVFLFSRDEIISAISSISFFYFPVFLYQSINLLPDNLALCFGLWTLVYFFKGRYENDESTVLFSALFLCLAALCKLPFIILGIVYLKYLASAKSPFKFSIIVALINFPVAMWYFSVIPDWSGIHITKGIFDQSVAFSTLLHYLKAQLCNILPSLVFGYGMLLPILIGLIYLCKKENLKAFPLSYLRYGILISLFYFVFILKQIEDGHDYYHYPLIPWFVLLITVALTRYKEQILIVKVLLILSFSLHPFISWNRINNMWNIDEGFFNVDFFEYREELRKAISSDELCIMVNDQSKYIVPYAVDKLGYVFMHDNLKEEWLLNLISEKQIGFMYSDSRKIDENPEFQKYFDNTIAEYGSIKLIKLKLPSTHPIQE